MSLFIVVLLLGGGLVALILGAESLVGGSSSLARRIGVSEIVIGLTVVAFGTSTPELAVNLLAAAQDRPAIAMGNVLGSNIFNVLVILGLAALIRPLMVQKNTVWKEIPFALLASLALLVMVHDDWGSPAAAANMLSRTDGIVLLLLFAIFITYTFAIAKVESIDPYEVPLRGLWRSAAMIAAGLAALAAGGYATVTAAVHLARSAGISERVIAITIVAAGTSLPELATSLVAARRGRFDIAVGNVVGSNIFNVLLVLGVGALIRPIPYAASADLDIYLAVATAVLLFVAMFTLKRHRLDRPEALVMLAIYVAYVVWLLR